MKHAKAPWSIDSKNQRDITIRDAGGRYVAGIGLLPTKEANARLIATAPELLEQCKKALQFIENARELGYLRLPFEPDPGAKTLPSLRAVIDKVEDDIGITSNL